MQYTSNYFCYVDYKVHQVVSVMHKIKTGKRNKCKGNQIKMNFYDTFTINLIKISLTQQHSTFTRREMYKQ